MLNKFLGLLVCFILFFISSAQAKVIIITGTHIINHPTYYKDVTLDMQHGSFLVTEHASLNIEHSKIIGTVSDVTPALITLANGTLKLSDNNVKILAKNITPAPTRPPTAVVISIKQGTATVIKNFFTVDQPYTVGLLRTDNSSTTHLRVTHNSIRYFHGGILIFNVTDSVINKNIFSQVSNGNIYIKNSKNSLIENNTILFSGNNNVGDSVDIIDSNQITISKNAIFSSSCYSIFILGGQNIKIDSNRISSGITYAIYITQLADPLLDFAVTKNSNISITNNYLSQNRFGLSASQVEGLLIADNIFIQRFFDNKSRQFWTNNDILLQNISNLTWERNIYKEAYTQAITEKNDKAFKFSVFPLHQGVVL